MAAKDKHCKPSGEDVTFFFSANAQYKKGESIPVKINGYEYNIKVGAKNTAPKEVLDVLKNCKSQTVVPDLSRTNPDRGGVPRRQEDFYNPVTTVEYQSDFDIEILK